LYEGPLIPCLGISQSEKKKHILRKRQIIKSINGYGYRKSGFYIHIH
jgi:hypothetical protein